MKRVLLLALLYLLSACASTPDPTSALGDSPTIKGTIANLAKAELDTSALTIKALIGTNDSPEKVIAEGTVSSSGVFSIKLPGLSVLASDLVKTSTNSTTYLWPCTEVENTPKEYNGARLFLKLYSNGQPVEEGYIFYGSEDQRNRVEYTFVDRDVVYKADCVIEDKTLNVNEKHKEGWNTVVATISSDEKQIKIFSGVPDSSFKWLIFICSSDCS